MVLPDEEIKKIITENKLISQEDLAEIEDYAKTTKTPLALALSGKQILTDEELGQFTADYLKLPFINLSKVTIVPVVAATIPVKVARRKKIIAFERDKDSLKVA